MCRELEVLRGTQAAPRPCSSNKPFALLLPLFPPAAGLVSSVHPREPTVGASLASVGARSVATITVQGRIRSRSTCFRQAVASRVSLPSLFGLKWRA